MTRDESDDIVIGMLAMSELELRHQNRVLVDLVADLTLENERLRSAFTRILHIADDARAEAQRQADLLWSALADRNRTGLDEHREIAA